MHFHALMNVFLSDSHHLSVSDNVMIIKLLAAQREKVTVSLQHASSGHICCVQETQHSLHVISLLPRIIVCSTRLSVRPVPSEAMSEMSAAVLHH